MRRGRRKGASKDRVFGCDLLEHLAASSQEIPQVLRCCSEFIEEHGVVDGIYRLSGVSSNTQKLRGEFDGEGTPDLSKEVYLQDIHCVSSLCKAYFRELPNPLLTYQLYDKFADAVALQLEEERLVKIKEVLKDLPAPHYRTLEFLMRHLVKMATFASETNMHSRNLAIVWAPNLLRSKDIEATGLNGTAAFMEVRVQSIVVEFILTHVSQLFSGPEGHTPERRKSLPSPSASSNQEDPFSRSIPRNVPSALGSGNGPPAMRSYHAIIDGTDKRRGSLKGRKWKSIFNLGGRLQDPRRKNKAPCKEKEKTSLRPAKSMDSLSSLPHTPEEKELAYGTYGPRQHPFLSPLTHPCPTLGREVGSAGGANSRYAVTYRRGGGACVSVVSGGGVHGTYSRLDSREANDGGGPPPPSRSAGVASRAERRAGMHISGPYSVTVPLHIASGLGQVLGGARHEEGGDPKEGGGAHKEGGGAHNEGGRAQREEVRAHMEEGGAHKEGGGAHREEGRACQEGGRAHREENGGSHSEEGGEVSTEDKSREGEVEGEKTVNRSEESRGEEGMTEHLSVEEEAATEDHEYMDIRGGFFTKEQDSQLPLDFQDTFGFLDLMDSSACNQANEFSVESPCYEEEDVYEEHSGYQGDAPSISTPEQPAQLPLTHRPLTLDLHGKPCKSHSLPLKSRPFLPALSITSSEEEEEDKEDEEEEGSVEEEDMLYYSLPSSLKFREAKEGAHKMADTDGPPTAERELEADACCDVSATSSVNISDQSEGELGHGVDGIDWQVALDRPEEMREDGTKEEDSPELKKKMGEEETGEREHTIGLRNTHGFGCGGGESGTAESEDQKGHEDHRGPEQNERDHTARNTEPKERDHKPEHMEPKERDHTAEHKEPKERDHSAELTESKERDHTAEQLTESKERDHTAELTESKERDHTAEQLTEPKERDHTAEQLTESKERDHIAGHTESKERDHTAEQLTEPKERDHTAGHTESKERDHSAELTESKERDHTAEQLTESKERDHTAELTESKERDHTAEQLTEPKERDHTAEQLTESKERDHIAEQLTESKERDHTAEQLTESKERDHTAELTESKERDHTAGHTESEERDHTAEQLTESKERDHSAELIESEERDHTADKLTESKERDHTAEFIESKERDHTAEFIESEERDHTAEFIESEERDHTAEHTESKERDHIAGHQESKERDHTAELIESKERDHTAELIESKERDHTAEHTESEERDHTAGHQESKERDHTARHTESEERDHTAEQLNDTGLESSAEDHRRRSQEDPYGSPGDSASGTKPAAESTECGKTPEPCPPPLPEPLQGPDTCAHLPPEPPATPGEREDTCREEGGERELEGGRGEGREREEEVEDGLGDGGGEREVEGQRKGRRENSMESQNHLVGQEKEERNGKRDETQERKVTLGEPERGREERDLRTKSENAHKHKTQPDKGERDEERSKGGEGDRGWGATQGRSAREEGLREARLPGVARKLVRSKQATPILYQAKAVPVVPPKPQLCKLTALTLRQQRGTARGREGAGDRDGERALGWAREKEDWRRGEIERREKEQERDRDAERAPGLNEEREEWRRGEMVRRERERGREGAGDIDEERAPGWDQEREEQRTGEVQREKERGRGGAGDMDRERVSSRDGERGERRRAEVEREGERGREGGKEGELERWGEGGRSPEKETKRNSGASVCFDVAVARATERREKERERGKDGQTEGRRGAEKVERNERSRGDEADRREAGENNWRKRKEKEMEGGKERESDRE